MHDTIFGNKVILRPISEADTELIIKWRNTPSVQNNFIYRELLTKEIHEAWLNNKVYTKQVFQFIIEDAETRKEIGSVYLRDIDETNKNAEFGIFIGDGNDRGKGFGTEAAELILSFGFRTLGLHRIFLRAFESNKQALTSYLRAGFIMEGIARDMVYLDGMYHNIVFMSCISNYVEDRDLRDHGSII